MKKVSEDVFDNFLANNPGLTRKTSCGKTGIRDKYFRNGVLVAKYTHTTKYDYAGKPIRKSKYEIS